ncbi:hypothetical protein MBLNU459_g0760t1 [Dothideomycetes sp. NU459]
MSPPNNTQPAPRDSHSSTSPRNSSAPLLHHDDDSDTATPSEHRSSAPADNQFSAGPAKTSRRGFFGLGKKKEDKSNRTDARMDSSSDNQFMPSTQAAVAAMRPVSPPQASAAAVHPASSPIHRAASPGRAAISSSPQPSLDPSTIFERDVQDSSIPDGLSSAIPAHIQTEDHIPPVLEASSLAITDTRLDPDHVEIVTHAAHQPAAEKVAESAPALHSEANVPLSAQGSQHESFTSAPSHHEGEEGASTYGTLDPNDVRRLSFISFADVVHAEHVDSGAKDTLLHHLPLSASSLSRAQSPPIHRSPSPVRSPLAANAHSLAQGVTTPPLSGKSTSTKGIDVSPARSPTAGPQQHGELTIETMRQALRKTGSGDLGAATRERSGSHPVSAIGTEGDGVDRIPFK